MFRLSLSSSAPTTGANSQRGQPAPGSGSQTTGPAIRANNTPDIPYVPERPTKGLRSWFRPAANPQQSMPSPEDASQRRPPGSLTDQEMFGGVAYTETPYYDRGAAAFVPNFGRVVANVIGAGIFAPDRPLASYGQAATYENGMIFWTSQVIPTSVQLSSLEEAEGLAAIVGQTNVEAMVRVG